MLGETRDLDRGGRPGGPGLPGAALRGAVSGYSVGVRFLAVSNPPPCSHRVMLRPRGFGHPEWHAVAAPNLTPIRTLCGLWCTSEAHRTWDKTPLPSRCPHCQQLVERAEPE